MSTEWEAAYTGASKNLDLEVHGTVGGAEWTWSVFDRGKLIAGGDSTSAAAGMRSAEQAARNRGDRDFVAPHPDRKDGCKCRAVGEKIPHVLGCKYYAGAFAHRHFRGRR